MKVYARRPKQPQQLASPNFTSLSTKPLASHTVRPLLQLQRTIGNHAVQQLLDANAEGVEVGLDHSAMTRFAHDFSRVPVFSKAPVRLQARLVVNALGDIYEQEAEHVADRVMRIPLPQLQRKCACGGGCLTCQTAQPHSEHEHGHAKHVGSNDSETTAAPPVVHEAVSSAGQPLDSTTRGFMESRFGQDFSRVRLHTDGAAAEAARAVQARAYTLGRDIVFGAGEYAPATVEGKRLLAHELAHTLQQQESSTIIRRVALHTGRILDEGSCYDLACRSRWAIPDERYGYPPCPAATMHAGRRMRPLHTCDRNRARAESDPCRETQVAVPVAEIRGGRCGQNLVICGNGRFTHGIVRDTSDAGAWEIGRRLRSNLGLTRGDITDGAIYADENDADFRRDSRCRGAQTPARPHAPAQPRAPARPPTRRRAPAPPATDWED